MIEREAWAEGKNYFYCIFIRLAFTKTINRNVLWSLMLFKIADGLEIYLRFLFVACTKESLLGPDQKGFGHISS